MKSILMAYGSVPKDGGTFTFYRNLWAGLRKHNIDMKCVSIGRKEADLIEKDYVDENCVLLAEEESDLKKQAMAFTDWCRSTGVDVVMPINSEAMLAALPHLPQQIHVISRCANAFDHGYRITVACYERLSRIIATTPRHIRDLTANYGVEESRLTLIPHGIDATPYEDGWKKEPDKPVLKVGFLGRLEHNQKGVFYLPQIVRILDQMRIPYEFILAGKGIHRKALEREMRQEIQSGKVSFVGSIAPDQVPEFLKTIDIFLFPSRFEGFGFSLIEAMMAGCVPIASKIDGITDFIIEEGRTGCLCQIGDSDAFARAIASLHRNRELLTAFSWAAAKEARTRFAQPRMVADYKNAIREAVSSASPAFTVRPWNTFDDRYSAPRNWKRFVPQELKKYPRRLLFHLRLSDRYV